MGEEIYNPAIKKILLLESHYTNDSADIMKVAVSQGWATDRTNYYSANHSILGFDIARYYGSRNLWENIKDLMPFWIEEINDETLLKLPQFTKQRNNVEGNSRKIINKIRCFTLNGVIKTSSYYVKNEKPISDNVSPNEDFNSDKTISDTPLESYCRMIYQNGNEIPNAAIMDFEEDEDRGWSLISLSPPPFGNLYHVNPIKAFEVILAAQRNRRMKFIDV